MVMTSRLYKADGTVPGFIYSAAKGAGGLNMGGAGFCRELARRGYPVISGDCGDTQTSLGTFDGPGVWGKDVSITADAGYRAYLQGTLGAKPGGIGRLYGSHGCALAYNAALAEGDTLLIAGAIGTGDVEDIRVNNRNGFQAGIESAYVNNAGWQAARPTHNPVEFAGTLTIPQLDYFSTDDPICTPESHAALLAAAGANMTQRSLGAIGHSFGNFVSRTSAETAAFCDWVEAHLV